jgi:hypothetical protein
MPTAVRLMVVVPILAILGWATMTAVDALRADDLVREASLEMGTWAATSPPAPETWASVRGKLDSGLQLRPNDPLSHELLGMLGSLRRDSPKHMDEGVAHLARALEMRPVSPYSWAMVVEARYLRGDPAIELELPMQRAMQLGPSEPGVQRVIAEYGLAVWPELQPEIRAQVDRAIASGMRRNPLEMLRISDRRGRLEAGCRHVLGLPNPDRRVGRYCERWEITP